ncbi:TIGR01458 family HAD-type hydrolase [Catenovulum sp. 2E275]|uniref:TIGR01458 family HAD-type hydrolase n=1 Tax=Catenovulum sp. 2E275 TaxID=2980497 RepID=UPI0021D0F60E|nr:TIGR01458 family HAD-type hydrolase [Catenovulum sp. 2E275]MCU4674226.1 TIGR01458 family HAD-type hydrolase [Catenovulum sp. 2E275]
MSFPFKAIFFDLSGVLYQGNQVINGALSAVKKARSLNLKLRFVTNTASKPSYVILDDLQNMGFQLSPDELFTAPIAAKQYIEQQGLRPYCLIHQAIKTDFAKINQTDPNCVLLGDAGDDLNYQTLNVAFQLCQQGAPLIGIGMNKYYKADDALVLDAGPFIKAIAWAASKQPIIMGKPDKHFFAQVVASTGLKAEQCLMIGDDVKADVCGALDAGLGACLVKTGKFQPDDLTHLPKAAYCIESVAELFEQI